MRLDLWKEMGCACLLGLCLAPLPAQQELRVTGRVVDEEGAPIIEARISILVHRDDTNAQLVERVLSERPLPSARSDKDGRYSLVFDALHLFMTGERPGLGLQIAKEGYQSWIEHLPSPLDNYQGSDAVLPLLQDEDYAEVRVEHPVPGTQLYLRRVGEWHVLKDYVFYPWEERVMEVPVDGLLRIPLALLPNPAPTGMPIGEPMRLGFELSLWSPGRSEGPKRLLGGDRVRFSAPPAASLKGPQGVRTLCRCEDGQLRWFPGLFVNRDRLLEPIAAWAPGYAVAKPGAELIVLPERDQPIALQILGEDGGALASARVLHCPLTALPPENDFRLLSLNRPGVRALSVDETGKVLLRPEDLAEPAFLFVEARGHGARIERLDLARVGDWQVRLESVPTGSFHLRVAAFDGEPIKGAMVMLDGIPEHYDGSFWPSVVLPPPGTSLFTDADGIIDWTEVPTGRFTYRIYARGYPHAMEVGYVPYWQSNILELKAGAKLEQSVTMGRVREIAIQVVLADSGPAPFAAVVEEISGDDSSPFGGGTHGSLLRTDSRGMLRVFRAMDNPVGKFRGAGSREEENEFFEYRSGHALVIEVADERAAAYRAPNPLPITSWGELRPGVRFDPRMMPEWSGDTSGVLFDSLIPRVLSIRDAPPIVFDPLEEHPREPRQWPVEFGDEVPADLSQVLIRALGIEKTPFFKLLDGDLAELDAEGKLTISTTDDRAYLCLFMHPQYLPLPLGLADGPVGDSLQADLERGVRVRLRYDLSEDSGVGPWFVTISGTDIVLSTLANPQQSYPLGTYAMAKGEYALLLPFAVPRNKDIEIGIGWWSQQRLSSVEISTGDGSEIEVNLGTINVR